MTDQQDNQPQADNDTDASSDIEFEDDVVIEREDEQPKDTIKRLRDRLKETVAQKQEYLDGWQRAKADAVNQKKAQAKERQEVGLRAKEALVADLLPVLDSFQMAMANEEAWGQVDEQWRAGVEQIHSQLVSALESHGVVEINPDEGDEFDPNLHGSVDTTDAGEDSEADTIARVEKVGYRIEERIIRSADVVVYEE